MITVKEKYDGVGNYLTLMHGTFYHVKPYGSIEKDALYQGLKNKLSDKSSEIFSSDNFLFYYDYDKKRSFRHNGMTSELISDKAALYRKIGSVYLGVDSNSMTNLYDKSFQQIEGAVLVNKILYYSNNRCLIYLYSNTEYQNGKKVEEDQRHRKVIECTDFQHNVLWTYSTDHFGFYETIEKIKREFDVNRETGESIERVTVLETKQNPVLFWVVWPLVIRNIMFLQTANEWIIAIDITTGSELYVIKRIEKADFKLPFMGPHEPLTKGGTSVASLNYHAQDDIIYSFINNTYLEIDYRTGKLLTIDNRTNEFIVLHKTNGKYCRVDDIIYYISYLDLQWDKKKDTAYLTAYNVKKREIVFEYPLGKTWKEKYGLHAAKNFQLIGNRFYILDHYETLWVFEDDDFYYRHPTSQDSVLI